jgi:S-DNA-T family DNA segregation ATPase FtsK/SpoIIIE
VSPPAGTDGTLVRLGVVVQLAGGEERDVLVEAPPGARTGDVVARLAVSLGLGGNGHDPVDAFSPRLGRPLAADEPFAESVQHGDRVRIGAGLEQHPVAPSDPTRELVVVGGMGAGRRRLDAGDCVIGRDEGCTMTIDDPTVSRAHLRVRLVDGAVSVVDVGSENGTSVEGRRLAPGDERLIHGDEIVRLGRTLLTVEDTPVADGDAVQPHRGTVAFNRSMRVVPRHQPTAHRFAAPPDDTTAYARVGLLASAPFALLGVALWLLTGSLTMLLFVAIMPLMALMSLVEQHWGGRRGRERQARKFRARLAGAKAELDAEWKAETHFRRQAAPCAADLVARASDRLETLWERSRGDGDFLELRIGSADRPAYGTIALDPGGSEALRAEAQRLFDAYTTVPAVPVTVPLAELGALGVCGPVERVDALARLLVLQAATLHSPRDLVVAAALDDEDPPSWGWLKWLPHVHDPATGLGVPIGAGLTAARAVVEQVLLTRAEREAKLDALPSSGDVSWTPIVLLVVDERSAPDRSLAAELLDGAARLGIAVLWLGRDRRGLPGECRAVVELGDSGGRLSYREEPAVEDVLPDGIDARAAREWALALAPLRDVSAAPPGGGIPDRVGLSDLLGADGLEPAALVERWRGAAPELAATIGRGSGAPFAVDLRADGPHALVAGITGAGKSELLQTLIAGFAASHPPTRLTFLLIDYKGGLAFKECVNLPHTVGFVTDLDEHLTQRALVSLRAELRRRETVLREAGARDLAELERHDPARAPASLVIVIDEFAGLAEELPDFIDGVVDVARRGRSLGVHLILATQRPGGVVSQQIRANTNLRIALRVNETAESVDIIGGPEAARIPRALPGRAFALTGHGDLSEFQAGYSAAVTAVGEGPPEPVVREFGFGGGANSLNGDGDAVGRTDLERLVDASRTAAARLGLNAPPSPWLEPLEPLVPLASLAAPTDPAVAVLGLVDEPAEQAQRPFSVDLERDGSLLVFGTSGSGKTSLLRTLAVSLAERSSPDELHVYGLDFASRALAPLEALPHCACVIAADDEERVKRLLAQLRHTLESRKKQFEERGAFTLSEFRNAGGGGPRILVLLDGYGGFADAFFEARGGELLDAFAGLVRDGRPIGVHFAIASDRRGAVPNALAAIIPTKVVLRMAEEDEYLALGVSPRAVRGATLPPGRGFVGGLELQCALVGGDPSADGQLRALAEIADESRKRWGTASAPAVEVLPARLDRAALPPPPRPLQAIVGIDDTALEPVTIDVSQRHFLVAGPFKSGRTNALNVVAESLHDSLPSLELHLLAPRRSALCELGLWTSMATGADECEAAAERLAALVEERRPSGVREADTVLVVDDADELADGMAALSLETVVRLGRDLGVRVVAAAERHAAGSAFGGWVHELRKSKYGLLLEPDLDVDGDILRVRLPRWTSPVFPPGRGFLVDRGTVELIQVARA